MTETLRFMLHSLLHLSMVNMVTALTALQVSMMFFILTLMLESVMVTCLTLVLSLSTVILALEVKELDSLTSTVRCNDMEESLTDLIANTIRSQATACLPLSMVLATNLEDITRLPLEMEHPNSQLRTMTRSPPRRRLRLMRNPPRMRLTRNLPRLAEYLARKTSMSLSVIHSREASVAVPDRSVLVVKILLTTLISHIPALTAWIAM